MNRFIIIITLFFACLAVQAQEKKECMSKEQFRERQKQYFADKADLTQEEAAKFFPLVRM